MANLLDRFRKQSVGSADTIYDYISVIESRGDFKRISGINALVNSWKNILLTPKRSYPYDPEYGSDLYKMVFEPRDNVTTELVLDEVIGSIRLYDDRATISNVDVKYLRDGKGYTIDIYVSYQGQDEVLSIDVTQDIFSGLLETGG